MTWTTIAILPTGNSCSKAITIKFETFWFLTITDNQFRLLFCLWFSSLWTCALSIIHLITSKFKRLFESDKINEFQFSSSFLLSMRGFGRTTKLRGDLLILRPYVLLITQQIVWYLQWTQRWANIDKSLFCLCMIEIYLSCRG